MSHTRVDLEEGREVVQRTIVGGRPRARKKVTISVPIGVERVLYMAATDPAFKAALFDQREEVVRDESLGLDKAEADILVSIPSSALAAMIDAIDVEQHGRRRFMKAVASSVVAAGAVLAMDGCHQAVTGSEPDPPPPVEGVPSKEDPTPPPTKADVEVPPVPAPTGINPDNVPH